MSKKLGTAADAYERKKERERLRQATNSEAGRDIAPLPPVQDEALRAECDESFRTFALTIFPGKFTKAFSDDHETVIRKMQESITRGMLFALAMPRGSGKTTLIVCAILFAIATGHRRYVAVIGPTQSHARKILRTVRVELETNDMLHALYPEMTHAVRRLERITNRSSGQLYKGKSTYIEWTKDSVVLATIPGAKCSGAVIEVAGITGAVRGMQFAAPTGETMRPDFWLVDDPQTKRSSKSAMQCEERLEVIEADCRGLGGPGEETSGFVLCTVITHGDLADQLLDTAKHPEYRGERMQLLYEWPKNEKLWADYAQIFLDDLAAGDGISNANAFYEKNRAAMDLGSRVAWEERKKPDELSALQHAMNLWIQNQESFFTEYQNTPTSKTEDTELLSVDELVAKQSGYVRRVVPPQADTITAFIDVQKTVLYWAVVAWRANDFSGWVLDYGGYPDQGVSKFALSTVRNTLAKKYPSAGFEGRIRAGLVDCVNMICGMDLRTPTDVRLDVSRIGVDAAWGESTAIVLDVCRTHEHRTRLVPCFGRGIKPSGAPMARWARKAGERRGHDARWIVRRTDGGGYHLLSDTNYWKSFVHNRFSTPSGDRGSLYLPKPGKRKNEHRMLAEHCRAEQRKFVAGDERAFDVWECPAGADNHLFDCVVHAAVLASLDGVKLSAASVPMPSSGGGKRKRKYGVSKLQA